MKNFNFREAIEKRRILPFSDGPKIVEKEIKTAEEDLRDAKDVLKLEKFKMTTVSAYYAIFHTARALLYKKKYREKEPYPIGICHKSTLCR